MFLKNEIQFNKKWQKLSYSNLPFSKGQVGFTLINAQLFLVFLGFEVANFQSHLASVKIKGNTKVNFNLDFQQYNFL